MKTMHESPLYLMRDVDKYNDYDYCLLHHWIRKDISGSLYRNWFRNSSKEIILDNSLYELGSFDKIEIGYQGYADVIRELKPTYYIIPDDRDFKKNNEMFNDWWNKYHTTQLKDIKSMGVLHGTVLEKLKTFHNMSGRVDIIGLPIEPNVFGVRYSSNNFVNETVDRYLLVEELVKLGCKKIHLLGTKIPLEVSLNYPDEVVSMDTSNPILHGLVGVDYTEFGLSEKHNTMIHDIWDRISLNGSMISKAYDNAVIFQDLKKNKIELSEFVSIMSNKFGVEFYDLDVLKI